MDAKRDNDIPMAAMWVPESSLGITQEMGDADIRESASVAHIYGQNRVAAESMTAFGTPGAAFGLCARDLETHSRSRARRWASSVRIHTSAHQPLIDKPPGLTWGRLPMVYSQ